MATPVVFNAVNYSIPAFGDVGYAQGPGNLSAYLIALATGTLQPTGGLFSLTADANFGPNFGLVSIYYKSASANIAQSGVLRLANTDFIAWRNFANSADLPLAVNTSNQLTFNGIVLSTVASGSVGAGLQFQIPYYAANGNAVSAATNIHYNAAGDFELIGGHNVVFDGATSGAVSMKAPATVTSPYTFTLPPNPGTANYSLQTDGAGTTTWAQVQTTAFREDYIVGTPSGTYTGSLTVFNLANPYTVGAHTLIVTLDGDVQTLGASADYLETNSTTVTFNFSCVAGERVSFIFSAGVTSIGGTVNSGTAPRLAQYAASGTTISQIGSDASANGFKITGLAAATANGDALRYEQLIPLLSYRRPVLQFGSITTVAVESGLNGTSGDVAILFPDGKLLAVNSTTQTTFDITRNCALSGTKQSGLRATLSEAANTWYALYAVRATDNDNTWVTVGDTLLPLQANYASLNSNFGSGKWCYLGLIRNGDNAGSTSDILNFVMHGNQTMFRNLNTDANFGGSHTGIILATSAGTTGLVWTYAAGTGTTQVPNNVLIGYVFTGRDTGAGEQIFFATGVSTLFRVQNGVSGRSGYQVTSFLTSGLTASSSASNPMLISLNGFFDQVLGIGPNPLL